MSEWLSGLSAGTFFFSVVSETKSQLETSVLIRKLASIKASCNTCVRACAKPILFGARLLLRVHADVRAVVSSYSLTLLNSNWPATDRLHVRSDVCRAGARMVLCTDLHPGASACSGSKRAVAVEAEVPASHRTRGI